MRAKREGDREGGYAMAERNPLGGRFGRKKEKHDREHDAIEGVSESGIPAADASLSGGLTSPATNASLSGPWAFLVQNSETGVRQQLRVDADAGEWR